MKVIDVIVKRLVLDLVPDSAELNPETDLKTDLNLSEDHFSLIKQRIEVIFDIRITKESFYSKSKYGELCEFILAIFNEHQKVKATRTKS